MPSLDHSKSAQSLRDDRIAPQSPNQSLIASAKNLVVAYGPREAARKLNLSPGTVTNWAFRYKWKQAKSVAVKLQSDPADALKTAIESDKKASTIALGTYTRKAAQEAAKSNEPLEIARKVRDVAAVYSTLWPAETGSESFEVGLLVGKIEGFEAETQSTQSKAQSLITETESDSETLGHK